MSLRLPLLLTPLLALLAAQASAQAPFVYSGPDGLAFTVTTNGLSSIRLGDRELAAGGWYAWNAGPCWFGRGETGVLSHNYYSAEVYRKAAACVEQRSLETLGPDRCRVRHTMPDAEAVFDYAFAGEDLTITARLENRHPDRAISIPAFGGLRFAFRAPPTGQMPVWHTSYLHATGLTAFHPSHLNRLGGSYATDGEVGVGLTPQRAGLVRTLFFWDYDDWNPGKREAVPARWLTYLRAEPIPPGGALTFTMTLRVSRNTDWHHLLEPYKAYFAASFGPRRYKADDQRLVAVAHLNRNAESIGPGNPYGFHGGFRRIDTPEGAAALCDTLVPALKAANGQGLIVWGQGGQEPRGEMYRADFDVLPPAVATNWCTLTNRFAAAGLRLGVTTRPRHMHVRLDWERDGTIDINPDDPQHLEILSNRFRTMIERGCTLFYLDSFGSSLEDVKVMRHLRERMGPGIATFAEHACDVMAVYSAFYSETDFWAAGTGDWAKADGWVPRIGLQFLEQVRWLVGPVPVISRGYDIHGKIPDGFETTTEFFFRNRMTPMMQDYTLPAAATNLHALQSRHMNEAGQWK